MDVAGEAGEWHAVITWIRETGTGSTRHEHLTPIVRGKGLTQMEHPDLYERVPAFRLGRDGNVTRVQAGPRPTLAGQNRPRREPGKPA